ncbi:CaiB/BaiF CoA-transferase family protein [Antarctobacter sp.]|uniref:CaiB/BaiF CoA transferase family protein n=1 Tax=Antarctobacter sp. TaxID=1872577 RepID=UPI002B274E53|nr:CaiB/BaiF CoA-transferase family protein [Antarctobacter sp.]
MAGAMSHLKVLDLSRVFAGPWAAQMLADFGAEVIKVEHVRGGDDVRRMGVPHLDAEGKETGLTSSFLAMNRGKKSLAVDLSKPEGQEIVTKLAAEADVLIENFKVGNMARFNLDYVTLSKINPKLIYCSVTGFGQTGPRSHLPGYDPIFQAMSGVMSITGVPDGAPGAGPNLVGYSISDINAGYYAVIGILAALNHRDVAGGGGQHLDIALFDAQVHAASHVAMNYISSGEVPFRNGTASQITCPWQVFDAADKPIMIAVGNDPQFQRLCDLLGCSDLPEDIRYATNLERVRHKEALVPLLQSQIAAWNAADLQAELEAVGIAAGPINGFDDVLEDVQFKTRNLRRSVTHATAGKMDVIANPIVFSDTPNVYDRAAPELGADTDDVLKDELGMTQEQLNALREQGVIG